MVSILASSAVDGFQPLLGRTTIKLVFVVYPLWMQHSGVRAKTGWLKIRIMCPSGAICLPEKSCFNKLYIAL